MTVSWRSRAIRSRSSTSAKFWTRACRRTFWMATPAAAASPTASSSSTSLNSAAGRLVGEVEVAEDLAADQDRHPEERLHRRVVRREPEAVGVRVEVGEAQRLGVDDQQAEDAVALGELADAVVGRVVDPDGDELRQAGAGVVEHAEGAVAGVDQADGGLDDAPQHARRVEVGPEDQDGVEQLAQALRTRDLGHDRTLRATRGGSVRETGRLRR